MQFKAKHIFYLLLCLIFLGGLYFIVLENSIENQTPQWFGTRAQINFRIDSTFSSEEIKQIKQALKDWEVESKGLVKLDSFVADIPFKELYSWRNDGMPTIYKATSFDHWPTHIMIFTGNHNQDLGLAMIFTGDIFIMSNNKSIFKSIILHEVGHIIIGNYHSANPKDLMYPYLGPENNKITKNDVKALRMSRGL